jgi:signal transduction histidine kinase
MSATRVATAGPVAAPVRHEPLSPWSPVAVAVALVGTAGIVAALVMQHASHGDLWFVAANAVMMGAWLAAGAVAAWRRTRDPIAPLLVIAAASGALGFFGRVASATGHDLGAGELVEVLGEIGDCIGSAVLFHLALSLPTGRLTTILRRIGAGVGYLVAAAMFVALRAYRPGGAVEWARFVPAISVAFGVTIGGLAMVSRYLEASTVHRRRLQWICALGGIGLAWCVVVVTANLLFEWPRPIGALEVLGASLVPLALATDRLEVATARSERLVTLVFRGFVRVCLVSSLLIVFVLGLVHRPRVGQRGLVLAAIGAMLVAAAAGPLLRPWLAELADRVVHGDRHPADEALRVLGQRLSRSTRLDDLLGDVVAALAASQADAGVELWQMGAGDHLECTAAHPAVERSPLTVPPAARTALLGRGVAGRDAALLWLPDLVGGGDGKRFRVVPVAHSGELLALLVLRRSVVADDFVEADQIVLAEVARQLGLVLHNAQLDSTLSATLGELHAQAEELRASRARVVAAADAERRRIERDLHDGAQQQLVALAVSIGVVRDLVEVEPAESVAILDELRAEVQTAIDGLRSLAHGIYPPLLASRGLTEAIGAATQRGTESITFTSDGVDRYSAEVEAAVYFCCLEALQNAAKHAAGHHVAVSLAVRGDVLHFTIADDGPGFDATKPGTGQGRINMVDRVGAVGGRLVVRSSPGAGTVVEGSVPIDRGDVPIRA